MPDYPSQLEYLEEDAEDPSDLFGSPPPAALPLASSSSNRARPINTNHSLGLTSPASSPAGPSRTAGPSRAIAGSSRLDRGYVNEVERRLEEIRQKKLESSKMVYDKTERGVRSLKACSLSVICANAARIWDIGELEYDLVRPLIDDLPMEQLLEIEGKSPHIKKDTDWLWEGFILREYPLFHERCKSRKGEERSSGWRRMYRKATEDAEERQRNAAVHMAERYKQLEEEKAAKRIVFVDKVIGARGPKQGRGRAKTGGSGGISIAKPVGALGKARSEAQRARVALTHAAGRYIPPTPSTFCPTTKTLTVYKAPESRKPVTGPRLPPPRSSRPAPVSASAETDRIPGAYRTTEAHERRAALPAHLVSSPMPAKEIEERFRIDEKKKKEWSEIRRPELGKFEVPKKVEKRAFDFFGDGLQGKEDMDGGKRKRISTADGTQDPIKKDHPGVARDQAVVPGPKTVLGGQTTPKMPARPKLSEAEEKKKLENVLFRKRSKPKVGTR